MIFEQIHVECYSGYKANERPVAFTFRDQRWEVAEIVDRWYEGSREAGRPALDYFKVRTREGETFLLRYNALFNAWAIAVPGSKNKEV
ncbi:MAG: hypothetical protein JRC90_05675 [Deltaproteobacteria bacterium]|nr:hypothetical protein [Deltaproteobacteria bacterium]